MPLVSTASQDTEYAGFESLLKLSRSHCYNSILMLYLSYTGHSDTPCMPLQVTL